MLGVAPGYYTDGDVAGESKASGAVSEIGLELWVPDNGSIRK